jgi:hypothetical protein
LKIWIDYPAELGLERGVARDRSREGLDSTDMWKNFWMPLEAKYRLEQAPDRSADFIIDGATLLK